MAKFGGKLSPSIHALRSLIEEIIVSQELAHFRQINHVAVVQTVIVRIVLVEKQLCEVD